MKDRIEWERLEIEGEPIARKDDAEVTYFGTRLPFYASTTLIRRENARENARGERELDLSHWLLSGSSLVELDGSTEPIHGANRFEGLNLTEDQALPYLEFFCDFMKAEGESFRVLAGPCDELLAGLGLSEAARGRIRPPRVDGRTEDGSYLISACLRYGDELLIASFELLPSGHVIMLDDDTFWPEEDDPEDGAESGADDGPEGGSEGGAQAG